MALQRTAPTGGDRRAAGPACHIPTAHNVDHYAFTVPDLDKAVAFFVDVLGAEVAYRLGPIASPATDPQWMRRHLDVDPEASTVIAMLRLGPVSNIELFEYSGSGRRTEVPRACDPGGHHIGFAVGDLDRAVARLRGLGVTVGDPQPAGTAGSLAATGRWARFRAPWGMDFSLSEIPGPGGAGEPGDSGGATRFPPAPRWSNTVQPDGVRIAAPEAGGRDAGDPPGIPTARNVGHVAYTVADLDQAEEFFTGALGARVVERTAPTVLAPPIASSRLGVPGPARLRQTLLRLGPTANVELSEYRVPGEVPGRPRNSDVGGHHMAFWVDDIDAAVEYLAGRDGVRVLGDPIAVPRGPLGGGRWVYFVTPFGMTMEVLTFHDGRLPYEAETSVRRRAHEPAPWTS